MAARRILQLGDPLLRAVSTPPSDTAEAARILADLRDTLHEFRRTHGFGRGISAVQIGEAKRIIHIEFEGAVYRLIDPEFECLSAEKFRLWDDCFSFPSLMVYLERSRAVRVRYTELDSGSHTLEAEGSLAELLQHEMDHLDGILAVDRALDRNSLATREEYERRLAVENATFVGTRASLK